jgi:hypothetical protein
MLPFTVDLTRVIHGQHPKRSSPKGQCAKGQCANILNPVDKGQRNVEMTRRCGLLFHKGYTPSEVEGMLIRINNKCCKPPLGDREILVIFRSIAKREGK